jgi:hypothetical protein
MLFLSTTVTYNDIGAAVSDEDVSFSSPSHLKDVIEARMSMYTGHNLVIILVWV